VVGIVYNIELPMVDCVYIELVTVPPVYDTTPYIIYIVSVAKLAIICGLLAEDIVL
jgi:hypothetical protein